MADAVAQKSTSLAEQWLLDKEGQLAQNEAAIFPDNFLTGQTDEAPVVEEDIATAKENGNAPEPEESETEEAADEEKPEIKLETAPADFRFPTTNQTRHCFTRYIEYHRCIAAKGDDASECSKFAKYYRSLCPGEWIDRWNEQRENGTFPGPL
ncbi:Cytochrome c oxidase subunit 6b-1 [Platanthera zijinensis]|uniref:Cytochrome c oxidase subunit 6b-1 n=1 Tax=Platanthera zijinensis TaxID=2320716 RepID=A0AAP0AZL1_9ASPA